jgi:hypothetical protein
MQEHFSLMRLHITSLIKKAIGFIIKKIAFLPMYPYNQAVSDLSVNLRQLNHLRSSKHDKLSRY